jgi:cell shape-determining protein MreC
MEDKRARLHVSVIVMLLIVAFLRTTMNFSLVRNLVDPVVTWLDKTSSAVLVSNSYSATDEQISDAKLQRLESENNTLRDELGISKKEDATLLAEITRRDLLGFQKDVWISIGESSGVEAGQTVIADGYLFGIVEKVYKNSALVQTIIDPQFRTTVAIGKNHGVMKIGHGSLVVDLVPSKTLRGQEVVSDGFDGKVSTSIPVGILGEQISDGSQVYGMYHLKTPQNVHDVEFVRVIIERTQ